MAVLWQEFHVTHCLELYLSFDELSSVPFKISLSLTFQYLVMGLYQSPPLYHFRPSWLLIPLSHMSFRNQLCRYHICFMQVPPVCSPHVLPVPSASPSRPGVSMLMLRCEKTPDQAHTCMATFLVVWMCVCSAILYGHRVHGYYSIYVNVCFVDVCVCLEFKSLWALRQ